VLWSVESISHYLDRGKFFASAVKLIKPGGLLALTDWFQKPKLTAAERKKYIAPIEKGMFVRLEEMEEYQSHLRSNEMEIVCREELTKQCARTWDLGLEIIAEPAFWALAAKHGRDFVRYLKAFQAMRAGYASGVFVYGLIVARKLEGANRVATAGLPFQSGRAGCPAD
jgi:tocopherol O-methyltransferase